MDRLVKQLITPFITEQVKAKKVIAVYPGRFQPFGPHHKKVFQALQKKFGEVYITTSDIKAPPRHPMNFKEKVRHMVKMGIPKNRIVKERVPYVANNLLKRFDAEKTAVIYVFGAKDAGRLKGGKKKSGGLTYYQDYKKNKNKMVGYETHGYIYTAPHVNVSGISSGTEIRRLLGSPKVKEQSRKIIFKKTFGYFDKGVYNMLTNKFRKLFEVYSKFIVENKDYIKKLIKEASTGANFPTDDGPPTFYKGFTDYEKTAGDWVKEMGRTYGWEVYDYLISKTAQNPEDDYTLEYNIVPSVAFGRENTGDYGKRFGVKEPIKRYIEVADRISQQLGYEVIKYMGIKPDLSGYTGVEVESPVLPGRYDLGNTKRAELTGKQLGSGMTLLNTLEESLDLSNEVNMIFEDEQFKAKSKETGRVIVYKSKDNMDKAIKSGRAEPLDKKDNKVKGTNVFKKPQDNWETIDDKSNRVKSKDYTDEQYEDETGEYFENDKTMKTIPNLFKDKNDMIDKMKSARSVYLSSNKMEFMDNTDVGDILKSDNALELGKQRAKEYGKDWNRLEKAINSGNPVPPPIAVKDKNGDYYLLAGNTRLMSYTASGKKLPIKVIDYDGEFQYNESIHECIAFSKKFGDDIVIGKNRDRNYTPELKVVKEISGNGIEVCYVQDQDTDWSEGMNSNGIGLVNSALFVKRDEKDFDKAKKKKAPSKDGIRIRHALSKDTFKEVVESLVKFDTGVKGHTLVSDGKKLVVIENTSRTKPSIKIHDIDKSSIVRTNHGIKHPEQGYTRGPDRISSELRLKNAKELIDNEKEYKKVFPLFYNDTQSKGPKFDLVRAQNKLWTSSQILMNLNKKQLILYLIPGAVKFIGVENKLPKNYEPKIKLDVRQYEHGPSDKYDTFVTTDKTPKKSAIKDKSINENLLLEGGAYGHMSHPFDDKKLTFADLKKIIKLGLSGQLNREDAVTEKTDGQNLMITYRDGKVLAARNKGQIKNRGQNALDTNAVAKKFSGRGDIRDAFVFAMKDLSKSINSLTDKQKDKIFKNGEIFMNLEIIYPASSNVIDYDKQILQFHNSIKYDKNGNAVGEVKGSGRMLQGMIKQVNQDIGKHFKIIKPRVLDLPKKIDFGKKVDIYNKRVDKLKNQYGLKDNDTLGKYHQSFWEEYIFNAGQQFGYRVPKTILKKLTKRWAFFDKSYKIPQIRKDLKKQPKFLNWVMNTDKQNHKAMVKKNMLPFEKIFFAVGADILENLSNFIAANPTKAVEKIRREVLKASKAVRKAKDVKKMITLKQQLEKLNSIGGLKKIVPVEGIVFKYKGNTYKFTGAFAPVNQILGLVSF